jgi:hypothetical protein
MAFRDNLPAHHRTKTEAATHSDPRLQLNI